MPNRGTRFSIVSLLLITAFGSQQKNDPLMGTRFLAVAKSTFSPGPPIRKMTVKYEPITGGVKATITGIDGYGTPFKEVYQAKLDGKDYSVVGSPDWDTIALTRLDDSSLDQTRKMKGQVVNIAHMVLSSDGRLLTVTEKGADGQRGDVLVFERGG